MRENFGLQIQILSAVGLQIRLSRVFLRFTPPPLPLYGCKPHKHWAQAEGGVSKIMENKRKMEEIA